MSSPEKITSTEERKLPQRLKVTLAVFETYIQESVAEAATAFVFMLDMSGVKRLLDLQLMVLDAGTG